MTGSGPSKRPRWRLSAKLLVASTLITIIGFSAVCVSVMVNMRHGEEELARQTSENLASSIDADISRNIEMYDLSLRAVVTNLLSTEIKGVSRELRHLILFDHAATAQHFGAIQVFGPDGRLTIDASTLDPAPASASDDEYFTIQRDNNNIGLFISRPMMHRGAYSIVLSRRIDNADGKFAGVAAGAIRFSYFHTLFDRLRMDPEDTITVMRHDGIVMMRTPFDPAAIGRDVSTNPAVRRALVEQSGVMTAISGIDGIERQFVWRGGAKPLVVIVGKSWNSIYALWRTQAQRIAAVMAVLIAFAVAVTLFLGSEISRRARAEDSLQELAITDALTGLRNRRKFDQALELEWRRAERAGASLALLMIDADHFKTYNDRFGHQAGDQALSAIAGCIAVAARRAGDCAARYGGEEFALLLPGMTATAALQIADTICRSIAALDVEHAPLTVSIGVAALIPFNGLETTDLIAAADKALYVAKASGRNQSRLAASAQIALVA